MKILWITNTLFPDVCEKLGMAVPSFGGWMFSGAQALLSENKDIQLAVATPYQGKSLQEVNLKGVTYFLLPHSGRFKIYNPALEMFWKIVRSRFRPDVAHIHGTEYPHGLAYVRACGSAHVVASVQGLVGVYEKYYYGGINKQELGKNVTFRDLIRGDTVFQQKREMQKRGVWERSFIQELKHVIGRTSWDNSHVRAINPGVRYHFCNETLRDDFYQRQQQWTLGGCEQHSVFLSQGHYPIKGLQQMIKALPLIMRTFPNVKVYVVGNDFVNKQSWRLNGFGKYIRSLMKKNRVNDKFIFTGVLSEKEICERFLRSHAFACPSSIENSPNALGEAQLLGVPCVASFVGGVPDMIASGETGLLYQFEEAEMLANAICRIFGDDALTKALSRKGYQAASVRHNRQRNAQNLREIYMTICHERKESVL